MRIWPRSANGSGVSLSPRVREPQPSEPQRPDVEDRTTEIPQPELQRRQEIEQRKLESDLAAERARLARAHDDEKRQPPKGEAPEAVQQRHQEEDKAFEEHATQQRQVLQERIKKQIVKPNRAKNQDREKDREKGRGRGRGQSGEGQ